MSMLSGRWWTGGPCLTVVVSAAELSAGVGSVWSAETLALLVILPCAALVGLTTIIAIAFLSAAMLSILQVTTEPGVNSQLELDNRGTKVTSSGSVSVIVTCVACAGPLFFTVSM